MITEHQNTSELNKMIRDIIWIALFQIFSTLFNIIMLPVLTKTYTSEVYGIWTQVNVTYGLLAGIFNLNFVTALVRFLAGEEDKIERRRSFGTMLYTILIFTFPIRIVSNIWASHISLFIFNNSAYGLFTRLTFLLASTDSLFAFFISYWRARGKIKKLSIVQTIFSALRMGLIVVLVLSGLALSWVITSMILIELVFIFYVFFNIIREEGFPIPNFAGLKEFLAFSVPQIPVSILAWVMSASDRYFITHYLNLSDTGIYASSNSLAGLIALLYFPIGYVLYPIVSKIWEQKNKTDTKIYFEYSIKLFLTLAIPAVVGLSMCSQILLKALTTSEYLAGITLVLLIAISQVFMGIYQINEYIVYLVKQTKWLPLIIVISAGVSIGLNIALIPYFGITGAAISKIFAFFVLALIVTIWLKKVINYNYNFIYIGKVVSASLLMAVCLYFQKINGIFGILLDIIIGLGVFVIAMLLMKAFTEQDKQLLKKTFNEVLLWRR
jgi:O-antigen/teichoic acid export membrane protein